MKESADTLRKLHIIYVIYSFPSASLQVISEQTQLSKPSVKRQLKQIRDYYKMEISFIYNSNRKGRTGYYKILDWGIVSADVFIQLYGDEELWALD